MSTLEQEAKEWLEKNKTKNKNLVNKTQRAQLAAAILAGLIPLANGTYNRNSLIREAFLWADLIMEYS